jgi:Zn-dependent peptidase ImmA (M78 family)
MGPSKIQNPENGSSTKQFTMFHEVLHFLSMKEEIDAVSRGEPNPRSSS